MGFSDKLHEALGAGGVSLETSLAEDQVPAGGTLRMSVAARGGTSPARLEAFMIQLIEATRRWSDAQGNDVAEDQALAQVDRSHLTVTWDRRPIANQRMELLKDLDSGETLETAVEFAVPTDAVPTSLACTYTVNVQADVKGQIDPTTNARVRIG